MMARTHALTGTAAGTIYAAAMSTCVATHTATDTIRIVTSTVAGSILSDIDHMSATIANMWGPITRTMVRVLSPALGGHRGITHRPLIMLSFTAATLAIANLTRITASATFGFLAGVSLAAFAAALRYRVHPVTNLTASATIAAIAYRYHWDLTPWTLPLLLGILVHIAGDPIPVNSRRELAAGVTSIILVLLTFAYVTGTH